MPPIRFDENCEAVFIALEVLIPWCPCCWLYFVHPGYNMLLKPYKSCHLISPSMTPALSFLVCPFYTCWYTSCMRIYLHKCVMDSAPYNPGEGYIFWFIWEHPPECLWSKTGTMYAKVAMCTLMCLCGRARAHTFIRLHLHTQTQ